MTHHAQTPPTGNRQSVYVATLCADLAADGTPEVRFEVIFDPSVAERVARAYAASVPDTLRKIAARMEAEGESVIEIRRAR